jgi:hypothetical protein
VYVITIGKLRLGGPRIDTKYASPVWYATLHCTTCEDAWLNMLLLTCARHLTCSSPAYANPNTTRATCQNGMKRGHDYMKPCLRNSSTDQLTDTQHLVPSSAKVVGRVSCLIDCFDAAQSSRPPLTISVSPSICLVPNNWPKQLMWPPPKY